MDVTLMLDLIFGTPCRQEVGDRPHHGMTDETLPSFGCREASVPIAAGASPTQYLFRPSWFRPCATDEIPPVSFLFLFIDKNLSLVDIAVSAKTG
jgi:hypothetical protein